MNPLNWMYSAILILVFLSATLGVEATEAKRQANTAVCKTGKLEKELEEANARIKALEAAIEALKKAIKPVEGK